MITYRWKYNRYSNSDGSWNYVGGEPVEEPSSAIVENTSKVLDVAY